MSRDNFKVTDDTEFMDDVIVKKYSDFTLVVYGNVEVEVKAKEFPVSTRLIVFIGTVVLALIGIAFEVIGGSSVVTLLQYFLLNVALLSIEFIVSNYFINGQSFNYVIGAVNGVTPKDFVRSLVVL